MDTRLRGLGLQTPVLTLSSAPEQEGQPDSHGPTGQDGPPPGRFRPVLQAVFQRGRADQGGLCVSVCVWCVCVCVVCVYLWGV